MTHRILTVILASLLVLGLCITGVQRVSAGTTDSSLRVDVTSNYPGDAPQYTLTFTLGASVAAGFTLAFTFDSAVGHADGITIDGSLISVDGTPLTRKAGWQGTTLTLTAPQELAAGTEHTVIIQEDAGIQNPWTTGHYRITLDHAASGATLISNYYSVTTVTHLLPLAFDKILEYGQLTGVTITFKTGRNGALVGHDLIRGPNGLMVYPTTEDTMTLRLSAGLSTLWTKDGLVKLLPAYAESPFAMTVLSSTVYATNDTGIDQRQLVLNLPHNLPANTQMSLSLMFATAQDASAVSNTDYVKFTTSKETTLVMVPPQPTSAGSGSQPGDTTTADTTAPTVIWTSTASTLLPRLVTLHITVTEDKLEEAWFSGGAGSFIHTRLSIGDNTIMVINRTGIHGSIVATDKAGNTTTVPVDLPAPSGT